MFQAVSFAPETGQCVDIAHDRSSLQLDDGGPGWVQALV